MANKVSGCLCFVPTEYSHPSSRDEAVLQTQEMQVSNSMLTSTCVNACAKCKVRIRTTDCKGACGQGNKPKGEICPGIRESGVAGFRVIVQERPNRNDKRHLGDMRRASSSRHVLLTLAFRKVSNLEDSPGHSKASTGLGRASRRRGSD